MSSPPRTTGGRRMMIRSFDWRTRANVAARRNVTRPRPLRGGDARACPPSHLITHIFCALSRYGVTTVRSFPLADFSVASGMLAALRLLALEIVFRWNRCLKRPGSPDSLTPSNFGDLPAAESVHPLNRCLDKDCEISRCFRRMPPHLYRPCFNGPAWSPSSAPTAGVPPTNAERQSRRRTARTAH